MNIFEEKALKFEKLENEINEISKIIFQKFEKDIIEYNLWQLNELGVDSDGDRLEPKYADFTVRYKKRMGQTYEHVTLRDRGDFQNAFFVRYENEGFSLYSTDGKTEKLVSKYGKNIFGLMTENIFELIEIFLPEFIIEIKKRI